MLLKHKKYHTWFPLGGHIEVDEFPHETAVRKVKEESEFNVTLLETELVPTPELSRIVRIPAPFCLLHEGIDHAENFFDFIYIAEPMKQSLIQKETKVKSLSGFLMMNY